MRSDAGMEHETVTLPRVWCHGLNTSTGALVAAATSRYLAQPGDTHRIGGAVQDDSNPFLNGAIRRRLGETVQRSIDRPGQSLALAATLHQQP